MKARVAVVGTGAMGRGIVQVVSRAEDMEIVAIADADPLALQSAKTFAPRNALATTNAYEVLGAKPDVLVEATPTIFEAAQLTEVALSQKVHVVLMNSEVDQVFGRILAKKARENGVILTSDAGDQHAVLIRIMKQVKSMGFEIIMLCNNKGFLDHYATPQSIKEEAAKRRLSLKQCASYTDGTKLSIEMALVANATGLGLLQTGMVGPRVEYVDEALKVFDLKRCRELGGVVDYVLGAKPGASVFVIGYSDQSEDHFYMDYYKMGSGPYYLFVRPYHLCHYETPYAIRSIMKYKEPILVQKDRFLEVGSRAKKDLKKDTILDGIGGYCLYGVLEKPGNLPIGLSEGTVLKREKKKDEPIGWDDVEFPNNDARLSLWQEQVKNESV